jgi:hypothetical protein
MVTKVNKEERGVGMQNFKYAPAWDEFVYIVKIHSPHTHTFLSDHLPVRTIRSLQCVNCKISCLHLINGHLVEQKSLAFHAFQ